MAIDLNSDGLEPGIPSLRDGTSHDGLVLMAYSQAVSLKRIADSLATLAATADAVRTTQANLNSLFDKPQPYPTTDGLDQKLGAEPKTDDNDWIDWPGGECPVPDGMRIDVKFRYGAIVSTNGASLLDWGEFGAGTIVAYRISK